MKRCLSLLTLGIFVGQTVVAAEAATHAAAGQVNTARAMAPSQRGALGFKRYVPHVMLPRPRRNVRRTFAAYELQYGGGSIEKNPKIYVTYWNWTSDPSHEAPYLQGFLAAVGGNPWLNTVTQYYESSRGNITDPAGQLKGVWSDNADPAPSQPTDAQIQAEAFKAVKHFGYDRDALYYVATPTGKSTAGFGTDFCAYHGAFSTTDGNVAYVNLPYMTDAGYSCGSYSVSGLLDGVSIVAGHELAESQTDPVPFTGWNAVDGEIGDKCAWTDLQDVTLTGGTYAVQPLWNNVAQSCSQSSTPLPLDAPDALAIDSANHLYVGNGAGNEVFKYDLAFNQYASSTIARNVNAPVALAFDPKGDVVVANELGNSVTRYTPSGAFIASQTLTSGISKPLGLAVDAQGNVYVANADANTITIYSATGKLTRTLSKDTSGRAFKSPDALRINGPDIYVGLVGTESVVAYNLANFLAGSPKPLSVVTQGIKSPSDIAFDSAGDMFVSNFEANDVTEYSKAGKLERTITSAVQSPSNVVVDAHGNIYVANYHANTVTVYNAAGTLVHTIH